MKQGGQGIVEYVVILTLIVAALLLAAKPLFRPAVDRALYDTEQTALRICDGFLSGD
jgi:hypothetical protein